jgi:hypothetical protein
MEHQRSHKGGGWQDIVESCETEDGLVVYTRESSTPQHRELITSLGPLRFGFAASVIKDKSVLRSQRNLQVRTFVAETRDSTNLRFKQSLQNKARLLKLFQITFFEKKAEVLLHSF